MDINTYNFLILLMEKIYYLGCGLSFLLGACGLAISNHQNKLDIFNLSDDEYEYADIIVGIIVISIATFLSWSYILFFIFRRKYFEKEL